MVVFARSVQDSCLLLSLCTKIRVSLLRLSKEDLSLCFCKKNGEVSFFSQFNYFLLFCCAILLIVPVLLMFINFVTIYKVYVNQGSW